MIEPGKKLKELSGKLNNRNPEIVSGAINSLRDKVPFKGAVALLADLFQKTSTIEIKNTIRNFLNDLKEPGAREEIISEIKTDHSEETIAMLVASCWQSGLDYSEFARDITETFVKGNYLVALESFTVLEESLHNIGLEKRIELIAILENKQKNPVPDKTALTKALIALFKKDIPPSS